MSVHRTLWQHEILEHRMSCCHGHRDRRSQRADPRLKTLTSLNQRDHDCSRCHDPTMAHELVWISTRLLRRGNPGWRINCRKWIEPTSRLVTMSSTSSALCAAAAYPASSPAALTPACAAFGA